jgi:hypothetical protein
MNVNEAGITGRGNVFGLKGSVDAELSSYKLQVKDDPARSKHIFSIGEQLIEYAAKGEEVICGSAEASASSSHTRIQT